MKMFNIRKEQKLIIQKTKFNVIVNKDKTLFFEKSNEIDDTPP